MTDLTPRRTYNGVQLLGAEPWPPEVVELAFEVWAFKTQRSVRETVDFLNNLPDEWEEAEIESLIAWQALKEREMPFKTVANWVTSRKWEAKRVDLMKQLAPAMYRMVQDELNILTIDALRVQKELLLDNKTPAVVRAKIIDSVLDRTGHQPFTKVADDSKPRGPQVDYGDSVAGKTVEELKAMLFGTNVGNTDDSLENEAAKVRRKTGNYCWYCGIDLSNGKMTIDHVIPRSKGGPEKCVSNLIPACSPCNEAKGSMSLEEYRQTQDRKTLYGEKAGWEL